MTFVLTDIVSSTVLWQEHPDTMALATRDHERILRAIFKANGGYEFGTAGDSFAVAFASAADAVAAAAEVQIALASHEWDDVAIHVRIGVHSGQAEERDGRYFGPAVNRAARIQALAGEQQVLVSQATYALAAEALTADHTFVDIGEHKLKSFARAERLFQMNGPGLSTAPLAGSTFDTLPTAATRFVGRAGQTAALTDLVEPGSTVTVTGLGGLGKSRVAVEAARLASSKFIDGVWWIDLTPLPIGSGVAQLVATELGLTHQTKMSAVASVTDGMRQRKALLVFDNGEHVIDGLAELVSELGAACPGVGILTTSRVPLEVSGERNWPLAPLSAETDGLELLVERARAQDASFDPDRWPKSDLVDLCRHLDGIPLAIEMAAARMRALSPAEVTARLEDRFRLLRSRDRNVPDRHQTLLAALDWSYELLTPDERILLDRLSIFAGGFDLRAAENVCGDDPLDEFDVIDLLTSLIDKSLVAHSGGSASTRYRMLETVREYCAGHLDEQQHDSLGRNLVRHAVDVARVNDLKWLGDDRAQFDESFDAYVDEWDNFREAIRFAVSHDDPDSCDIILRSLWMFAFETFRNEIGDWARSTLDLDAPPLTAYGMDAMTSLSSTRSTQRCMDGLAGIDESVPSPSASLCYGVLYWMFVASGDEKALHYGRRGLFHAQAMGSCKVASMHANLAALLIDEDPAEAQIHADEAHRYLVGSTNPWRATCMPSIAWYEAKRGRPEVGYRLCTEGVEMSTDTELVFSRTMSLVYRARISTRFAVGEPRGELFAAVKVGRDRRAWYPVWVALGDAIPWLAENGHTDLAETIKGHMDARDIWYRGSRASTVVEGVAGAHQRQTTGSRMRRDEIIDFVLQELAA